MLKQQMPNSKITSAIWGPCDDFIVSGHDDGTISQWNMPVCLSLKEV